MAANLVAVSALPVTSPVTSPVKSPANNVAVNKPELELKVRLLPVSIATFPVADCEKTGKHVVSVDSSVSVTVVATVATAAVPLVSWLPDEFTPGKSIFAEPLKLTPPIFLAVARIVAVAATPDVF